MENRKESGIFLGVIGVATLVVAIIGATFAYFSASAGSGENAITATSTVVDLGYNQITSVMKTNLIPAYDNIALAGAAADNPNGVCVDKYNNDICGVYEFFIGNPSASTTQSLTATINVVTNDFVNLYFRIYDITGDEPVAVVTPTNLKQGITTPYTFNNQTYNIATPTYDQNVTFSNEGKTLTLTSMNIKLAPSANAITDDEQTTEINEINVLKNYEDNQNTVDGNPNYKKYRIVVWLRDTGTDQPFDSGKSFSASINFSTGNGSSGVTGVLAGAGGDLVGENYTAPAE